MPNDRRINDTMRRAAAMRRQPSDALSRQAVTDPTMELTTQELPNGVERIALAGRMDTAGAQAIDLRFTSLATTRPALIVVDLSQVSFLASMGIRTLLSAARALMRRGGRMVLASPQPLVGEVLKVAGIEALIPVYADVASACAGLTSATGST
jgi:anti-sigma B factor antagonist